MQTLVVDAVTTQPQPIVELMRGGDNDNSLNNEELPASTPGNADVVNYEITIISGLTPPNYTLPNYTLTPTNSTFSCSGVTASLSGLTLGVQSTDTVDVASNLQCPPVPFQCHGIDMFNDPLTGHRLFYVVLGFGQADEVVASIPVPFATRFPSLPPPILWLALTYQVTGVGSGSSLLDKVNLAQRYYAADNAGATCRTLGALVHEVQAQDGEELRNGVARRIIAYAQAIRTAIACNICD